MTARYFFFKREMRGKTGLMGRDVVGNANGDSMRNEECGKFTCVSERELEHNLERKSW